jgi:hypothetical protein
MNLRMIARTVATLAFIWTSTWSVVLYGANPPPNTVFLVPTLVLLGLSLIAVITPSRIAIWTNFIAAASLFAWGILLFAWMFLISAALFAASAVIFTTDNQSRARYDPK